MVRHIGIPRLNSCLDAKDMDGSGDVLHGVFAQIGKTDRKLLGDMLANGGADADPAGLGKGFEPRRNVDAVAKNIVALYDHVAHVDPDAKADAATFIDVRIAALNSLLDDDGAAHRIDDRRELYEKAVARRLEDATLMLSDQRIDELPCGGPSARRASLPRRCP